MEDERLAIRKIVIDSRTATAGTGSDFQVQLPETVTLPKHYGCYVTVHCEGKWCPPAQSCDADPVRQLHGVQRSSRLITWLFIHKDPALGYLPLGFRHVPRVINRLDDASFW